MNVQLTNDVVLSNYCKPYIIAEIGSNHNGDMDLAKELIVKAKDAGADCVKFQSWSKDTIFSRVKYEDNYFLSDDYRDRNDYSLEEIVEKYSISEQELLEMKRFSDEVGIDCTSTPFSHKEVDFIVDDLDTPFIKVASMDLNNYPFLEYIAKKGKPVVLSTGLSDLYEIDQAVRTIENAGNTQVIILHCVSIYPPDDSQVNLNNIDSLQRLYPYPIGFSDHTLGVSIPIASTVKGAVLIEKHFTLDKEMEGWDHKVSANPGELKEIVQEVGRVHRALGSYRISSVEDEDRKQEFRRSIVTTRELKAGEKIEVSDLDYKRPGVGMPPGYSDFVVGRTVKRDLSFDHILVMDDFV